MDIISLGKVKKVKEKNNKTLTKMGVAPEGAALDVAARVTAIEALDPKSGIIERIGNVSAHTAINLNKHNLQIGSYLNTGRSDYKAMVYEDFADASGIDMVKSTGIEHDAESKVVKVVEGEVSGEVVLNAEVTDEVPVLLTVSMASSGNGTDENQVVLEDAVQGDTSVESGVIRLSEDVSGIVAKEGVYESNVIDMGDNFKSLYRLNVTELTEGETSIEWHTATSSDGISFEEYVPLNMDGTIASTSGRYVKLKAILKADGQVVDHVIHDFTPEEASQFESNEFVTFDGALKLKTSYEQEMTVDETYMGEGTLLKAVIDRSKFKKIERLEVTSR